MAQKSKPLQNDQKSYSLSMRLALFVKLKCESSTIVSFVGIRYSMCDLLHYLNYYVWPANYSDMRQIQQLVSASSGFSSPRQAV